MPCEIRVLRAGDEAVLADVAPGVFDNAVDPGLTRAFLADRRHHIAVAIDAGVVVGFASGVDYVHPDKPAEMWINEVGVAPTHQQRGLGRGILGALLGVAEQLGCVNAWVLTDETNTAARALYASLGGVEGAFYQGPSMIGFEFDLARTDGDDMLRAIER